jgi:hypothetical protein
MKKTEPDDVESGTNEPENLVCSLATALVHQIDALDNMFGETFSKPLDIHLLHHLAYRAGLRRPWRELVAGAPGFD